MRTPATPNKLADSFLVADVACSFLLVAQRFQCVFKDVVVGKGQEYVPNLLPIWAEHHMKVMALSNEAELVLIVVDVCVVGDKSLHETVRENDGCR